MVRTKDFLLEIGLEEVPAAVMPAALQQLEERIRTLLSELRLSAGGVRAVGTPRRLAVLVDAVADYQEDLVVDVRGPAIGVAFDEQGKPTKAAEGFARSQGLQVTDLVVREVNGGTYLFAHRLEQGRPAREVLAEALPDLITGLEFPKSMRWGDNDLRFVRPLHWLVALLGDEVLPFTVAGISAGRISRGRRFSGFQEVVIAEPAAYVASLREAGVVVDQEERRQIILHEARALAAEHGGQLGEDRELLDEVVFLVEEPQAFAGRMNPDFLRLPAEVLITSMRSHQRYFPVFTQQGLAPVFIAVRNGKGDGLDFVRAGNEKVLRARLADAMFFFAEDKRRSLEERLSDLEKVMFQAGLGSLRAKVQRVQRLVGFLAEAAGIDAEVRAPAVRAARLCKSDLVTNMVGEFPELQGIMGAEYARRQGESEAVALAIREHYLPRSAGDQLPATTAGALLSLADRLDTIAGCFAVGIQPTGSQDPYGLRRHALAVLRIMTERSFNLALPALVTEALRGLEQPDINQDALVSAVLEFFAVRMATILQEAGVRYDTVEAVLSGRFNDPERTLACGLALDDLRRGEPQVMADLLTVYRRAANLAAKAGKEAIQVQLLQENVEKELYQALESMRNTAQKQVVDGAWRDFFATAASLRPVLDAFLDGVMVMVDEPALRDNRLALLREVRDLSCLAADLGKIVQD
ncbi:MAG TPA: glycine--tRNA ligase subunit beta [Firmicutes bacterium]|jgi:glycyl-tRNA synthetase beta chain|nr:glycine--tRNA ligase subunit beta [Bacillota bacterium]